MKIPRNDILIFFIIIIACFFVQSKCQKTPVVNPWMKFGTDMVMAGKKGDPNMLLDKFTLYRPDDSKRMLAMIAAGDPNTEVVRYVGSFDEKECRNVMLQNCGIFMESYEDLFEGRPVLVSMGKIEKIKGADIFSVVVWVKKGEKYHGILIDKVWLDNGRPRVVSWSAPDLAFRKIIIKRAILDANSLDECEVPKWIKFNETFMPSSYPGMRPLF